MKLLGCFPPIAVLDVDTSVLSALQFLGNRMSRHAPITDSERNLVGIVGIHEIMDLLGGGTLYEKYIKGHEDELIVALMTLSVDKIMRENPIQIDVGDLNLENVLEIIVREGVDYLPITSKGKLIGSIRSEHLLMLLCPLYSVLIDQLGDVMTKNVISLKTDATVMEVMKTMVRYKIRHVPLVEDGQVKGILSSRDLLRFVSRLTLENPSEFTIDRIKETLAYSIASRNLITLPPHEKVGKAIRVMGIHGIGSVLITEEGELKGIVTMSDILRVVYLNRKDLMLGLLKEKYDL